MYKVLIQNSKPSNLKFSELTNNSIYIITETPCTQTGLLGVAVLKHSAVFITIDNSSFHYAETAGYKFRELNKGEKIIIEGV